MFELTGKIHSVSFDYFSGKPLVTFALNEAGSAREMIDELKCHEKLTLRLGKFKKKRSLDANAYFHLLCNQIARKLSMSDDEAKRWLVVQYGTLARDEDGKLIGAMLPAGTDVHRFYPYAREYKTEWMDGKEYTCYLFYERTRDLDTAQMSQLIDGTVQEAKCLGIETLTPKQLSLLKEGWHGNG